MCWIFYHRQLNHVMKKTSAKAFLALLLCCLSTLALSVALWLLRIANDSIYFKFIMVVIYTVLCLQSCCYQCIVKYE